MSFLSYLKQIFVEPTTIGQDPLGRLVQLSNGRFTVTGLDKTYARKRDALRGAQRSGLTVTE